ncbi:MAG: cupin domain-containing protein [Rhodanobacteraceae bacterium]
MQAMPARSDARGFTDFLPARTLAHDAVPWVPLPPGKSFKPLRFLKDDRGFVELLRLEPGETITLHRHTGEIHAFNLEGTRRLCTGEVIGPGGYVYEPPGNTDWWTVVGDAPLVVLVVVMGAVEYLDEDGRVTHRYTAQTLKDIYEQHCERLGIEVLDLVD